MPATDTQASLLRRFFSEFILFSIFSGIALELGGNGRAWFQADNYFVLAAVFGGLFLVVAVFGVYNPVNYFFDIKMRFRSQTVIDFVWRSSARNAPRSSRRGP